MDGKKVLLFGLGFFQRGLLKSISKNRGCIVVDANGGLLEQFRNEAPDIETVEGEASSIVTWKKIKTENISHIVSSVQDPDVVMEICRISRDFYKLDVPIIILWYNDTDKSAFEKYRVKAINPLDIGVEAVMSLIEKNYTKPTNIGLGTGEIVEVSILRRSHIVDRKMRYLQPNRWKVAAAYRDGKLIIPDGDFKLQIGDRAVLIGDPKVIDNIINILMKGTPEFPLQYGQTLAVLSDQLVGEELFEMRSFSEKTRARKFLWYGVEGNKHEPINEISILESDGCKKGGALKNFRSMLYLKDIGIAAISGMKKFSIFNLKMRYFFKKAQNPFLICRGGYPYAEVIISLNGKIPDRLIEIGSEVASLFDTSFSFVYVSAPGALKTSHDEQNIRLRQTLVTDYENLTRRKITFHLLEGNPVHETLRLVDGRKNVLLIVSADSSEPISLLSPHVPYLLAADGRFSVLVLPDELSNE